MAANTQNPVLDEGPAAKTKTTAAAMGANGSAERSFQEAADLAKASISEAAVKAQRVMQETLETLRAQSRTYADTAGEQIDVAQRYVVERVKERPVTATMAGLGVGLLLGLLLAGRNRS